MGQNQRVVELETGNAAKLPLRMGEEREALSLRRGKKKSRVINNVVALSLSFPKVECSSPLACQHQYRSQPLLTLFLLGRTFFLSPACIFIFSHSSLTPSLVVLLTYPQVSIIVWSYCLVTCTNALNGQVHPMDLQANSVPSLHPHLQEGITQVQIHQEKAH